MDVTKNIFLDLVEKSNVPNIDAMQKDANTRMLKIFLFESGLPWNVPEGSSVSVAFRNLKDGHKGWYDKLPNGDDACTVNGNVVTAILAPAVLSGDGEVQAAIVFQDAQLNQLATFGFSILVEKNPAAGSELRNDYYAYSTMEDVSQAVDAMLDSLEDTKAQLGQLVTQVNEAVAQVSQKAGPAIVCEAAGEVVAVADASDRALQGLTICGKTTQNGTPSPANPVPLVSAGDGGSIDVTVAGKNLLPNSATTTARNGLMFTVNADKSITVNGTATATDFFEICSDVFRRLPVGAYKVVGCPGGGSSATYSLVDSYSGKFYDHGDSTTLKTTEYIPVYVSIKIAEGTVCNNLVFKPMFTQDMTATYADYEPYKGQTLSLPTPNSLPGIPVASGGNYTDSKGQTWICDEIDLARGVYVQRIGKATPTTAFSTGTHTNGTKHAVCTAMNTISNSPVLSARYIGSGWTDRNNYAYVLNTTAIVINDNRFTTKAEADAILAAEKPEFIYKLATPIETLLDADVLAAYAALHSNKPNTTVMNDAGAGQKVAYVADTKTYIDQKFTQLQSAIIAAIGTI